MKGWTKLPNSTLLILRTASPTATKLYVALRRRAGRENACHPSVQTLAREIGRSISTVHRCLAELKEIGLVRLIRTGRTNRYLVASGEDDLVENPVQKSLDFPETSHQWAVRSLTGEQSDLSKMSDHGKGSFLSTKYPSTKGSPLPPKIVAQRQKPEAAIAAAQEWHRLLECGTSALSAVGARALLDIGGARAVWDTLRYRPSDLTYKQHRFEHFYRIHFEATEEASA